MPRDVSQELLDCLRRPNPYVEMRIEISTPDVSLILRRPDQWLGIDSPIVGAPDPADSLVVGVSGALELSSTEEALVDFTGTQSSYDLNREDPQLRVKGLSWDVDSAFERAVLSSFVARLKREAAWWAGSGLDFELQIFRVTKTPGVKGTTQFVEYVHRPLLSPAAVIKAADITWSGGTPDTATLTFLLQNYQLAVDSGPPDSVSPQQTSELPNYLFVVRPVNPPSTTGLHSWYTDTASSRDVADIGMFKRVFWARDDANDQWVAVDEGDVPSATINLLSYVPTGQAIYEIDLGAVPSADATGRLVFERKLPPGTSAAVEISTAGSAGPWTAIENEEEITTVQQVYHLRVTLNSDTLQRSTPQVTALGIDFRIPTDVSLESITEFPSREISTPWGKASIAEGRVTVLRTGIRDYLDTATILGSTKPATKLEADIFLASRHPLVTRDKWCRLERLNVTNRFPGPTSEAFTLLAYSSKLKRKLPQRVESLNTVHVVTAATDSQVTVSPALVGTTVGGNEYDGKGYYMRVRTTANPDFPANFQQEIQGNTDTDKLDFTPALPGALAVDDVIEVHSGAFIAAPLVWEDADPANVWHELLELIGIPVERVGHGSLPRGGVPPTLAERVPGDATTQDKLRVTNKISEQKSGDDLLYQVSALMGGATVEVNGQICWIQLYPQRDANGVVTLPLPAIAKTFDLRDIVHGSLSTPPGLEERGTVISAGYAQNAAAAVPDDFPKKTTVVVDNDALGWLNQQDLEDQGSTEVPEEIAQWCYNSTDEGLFLATQVASNVVRATATGMRLFPFSAIEMQPDLLPGDPVAVITDQYTDYDPGTQTVLKGPLALRGVLITVGNVGRNLRLFVQEILSPGAVSGGQPEPAA